MMLEQENRHEQVRIAVLLSSHNGEKYIVEQMESILGQRLTNALITFTFGMMGQQIERLNWSRTWPRQMNASIFNVAPTSDPMPLILR